MNTGLHQTLLSTNEMIILSVRIVELAEGLGIKDGMIGDLINLIRDKISILKKSSAVERGSEYTAVIHEKDNIRDDAFLGFRDYVKACQTKNDPETKKAAQLIISLIKKYGWTLYNEGYSVQSALMEKLISELEEKEAQNALNKIKALDWYHDMVTAQQDFEASMIEKIDVELKNEQPGLRDAKGGLIKTLTAFISSITSLDELYPGKFTAVITKIKESAAGLATAAKSRKTRDENALEEAEIIEDDIHKENLAGNPVVENHRDEES